MTVAKTSVGVVRERSARSIRASKLKINWACNPEDARTIALIARRAQTELGIPNTNSHLEMDLTACHLNGCPLDLVGLLNASSFDFAHDVLGIRDCIDRATGRLMRRFEPRLALDQGGGA